MSALASFQLGKQLSDLGILPPDCSEFVIRGRVNCVLEVEYKCHGQDEWLRVDWAEAAKQAAEGRALA